MRRRINKSVSKNKIDISKKFVKIPEIKELDFGNANKFGKGSLKILFNSLAENNSVINVKMLIKIGKI